MARQFHSPSEPLADVPTVGYSVPMTQVQLPIAQVDTPKAEYVKAMVVVEDQIIIVRNQVGHIFETITLDETVTVSGENNDIWTGTQNGFPIIVRKMYDCACGGTRVIPKP